MAAGPAAADGSDVKRIILTASGGPFLGRADVDFESVTVQEALSHPRWNMGRKVTIDSATLMNKGLEIIEACWLFDTTPDRIQVVVHPQSVIHSMVHYVDGSVIAQLGNPDMRTPIAHALAWPERHSSGVAALDLFEESDVLREYLGEDYCRYYTMVRRAESQKFHNHISQLDFDWYLRAV